MSSAIAPSGWAVRAQQACEWIVWTVRIQFAWLLGALAGGILLGVGPASVAAAALTRRRLRGEAFGFIGAFARIWRKEFRRANALLGPMYAAMVVLAIEAAMVTAVPMRVALAAGALVVAALLTVLVPMYVHYDLPLAAYPVTALRWMVRNPPGLALLACAALAIGGATWLVPGLLPFVPLGAWSVVTTALCLGLFAANDRALLNTAR